MVRDFAMAPTGAFVSGECNVVGLSSEKSGCAWAGNFEAAKLAGTSKNCPSWPTNAEASKRGASQASSSARGLAKAEDEAEDGAVRMQTSRIAG